MASIRAIQRFASCKAVSASGRPCRLSSSGRHRSISKSAWAGSSKTNRSRTRSSGAVSWSKGRRDSFLKVRATTWRSTISSTPISSSISKTRHQTPRSDVTATFRVPRLKPIPAPRPRAVSRGFGSTSSTSVRLRRIRRTSSSRHANTPPRSVKAAPTSASSVRSLATSSMDQRLRGFGESAKPAGSQGHGWPSRPGRDR